MYMLSKCVIVTIHPMETIGNAIRATIAQVVAKIHVQAGQLIASNSSTDTPSNVIAM